MLVAPANCGPVQNGIEFAVIDLGFAVIDLGAISHPKVYR
jgi:hypothetical protein